MLIIGIDPGKSGGVGWMDMAATAPMASKMPETVHELASLMRGLIEDETSLKVYLERVHAMPGQGVTSMFSFGQGLGQIEGVLAALAIPYEWVTPQKWQAAMACKTGGDKNVSKRKALELFPGTKWTHATADCALICEYGRRMELRGGA